MGISNKLNSILQNPLIDTIANTIKKFKSSKSYWSVSYLILLFTIREAVAWKFGSAIEHFFQKQAEGSEYPWVWDTLGFVFGVGGSIELVILGVVLFIILSSVKLFESKTTPETNDKIEEEHDKTRDTITQENQKLKDELLRELNIYGNKEKFLQEYFGDDWQKAIENPQTYHSLKQQLLIHQGDLEAMKAEKKELLQKIASRRLNDKVQKLIDKAFAELRFEDVRELLDTFIENNRDTEQDLINAHYQKALSYMQEVKYRKAKEEYETYIPIGIKDTDILHDYGTMYFKLGEYDRYLEVNTKRLTILLETSDNNTSEVARAYNEIGLAWYSKGEYEKAIEFYTKSLNICLATLGENHSSTATSYNNIGLAWQSKGEYDKAIKFYTKDLNITLAILGENHPSTAISYANIAYLYEANNQYQKAYNSMKKSVKIIQVMLPANHPHLVQVTNHLERIKSKLDEQK